MGKVIFHCDLNNFYASVECLKNPDFKNVPLAVTGNPQKRTGIVLAKNRIAKKMGVKTGEVIWKAKQHCPDLICVSPDFDSYAKYSDMVKKIYLKYTDFVEPFGIDECWLDVTKSLKLFGKPYSLAKQIKEDVKNQTGLTISVGVSFSKMFAKLGSKLADNDEINFITTADYQEKTWKLPVEKLIFVGRRRLISLKKMNINTIGDLACANKKIMTEKFGISGEYLIDIANGRENDEVANFDNLRAIKSIGNGTTAIYDLTTFDEAKQLIYHLSEMVAKRLREKGFKALSLHVTVKDNNLESKGHSKSFKDPTNNASEIASHAIDLFKKTWTFSEQNSFIRAIRISASNLISDNEGFQANLFEDSVASQRKTLADKSIDKIKNKYGDSKIKRAILLNAKQINCEVSDDFFEEE